MRKHVLRLVLLALSCAEAHANAVSWAGDAPGGFIGDGILAIFNESGERSAKDASRLALDAAKEAIDAPAALNRNASMTQPLSAGFALHRGQVSYGNIGAGDRLAVRAESTRPS